MFITLFAVPVVFPTISASVQIYTCQKLVERGGLRDEVIRVEMNKFRDITIGKANAMSIRGKSGKASCIHYIAATRHPNDLFTVLVEWWKTPFSRNPPSGKSCSERS